MPTTYDHVTTSINSWDQNLFFGRHKEIYFKKLYLNLCNNPKVQHYEIDAFIIYFEKVLGESNVKNLLYILNQTMRHYMAIRHQKNIEDFQIKLMESINKFLHPEMGECLNLIDHSNEIPGVYFLCDKNNNIAKTKIGYSKDCRRRIMEMKTSLPFEKIGGFIFPAKDEAALKHLEFFERYWHQKFAHRHSHREWFNLSLLESRYIAYVRSMQEFKSGDEFLSAFEFVV
jgi:hypothetical protein